MPIFHLRLQGGRTAATFESKAQPLDNRNQNDILDTWKTSTFPSYPATKKTRSPKTKTTSAGVQAYAKESNKSTISATEKTPKKNSEVTYERKRNNIHDIRAIRHSHTHDETQQESIRTKKDCERQTNPRIPRRPRIPKSILINVRFRTEGGRTSCTFETKANTLDTQPQNAILNAGGNK